MRVARLAGMILLVSLLVAACSSNSSSPNTGLADQPEQAAAPIATGPLPFDGVLIELFGTTNTDLYLQHTEQQAAELVVECMTDAGFEFQIPPADALPALTPDVDPAQRAATEGFGVIADFLRSTASIEVGASALTSEDQANIDYLATLSAAEIERFFVTLDGVQPEAGQQQTETGCNGQASDQAYSDWVAFSDALPNFRAMAEERDSDPDWLSARTEWQQCMTERGYDYAEPRAIESDVTSRMRAIVLDAYPDGELPLIESQGALVFDPQVRALLDEMMAFEIDAAVADIDCTEPLSEQFDAVDRRVQQGFVDRNQATIDELLARR